MKQIKLVGSITYEYTIAGGNFGGENLVGNIFVLTLPVYDYNR